MESIRGLFFFVPHLASKASLLELAHTWAGGWVICSWCFLSGHFDARFEHPGILQNVRSLSTTLQRFELMTFSQSHHRYKLPTKSPNAKYRRKTSKNR